MHSGACDLETVYNVMIYNCRENAFAAVIRCTNLYDEEVLNVNYVCD